jgi:hypothetical protein
MGIIYIYIIQRLRLYLFCDSFDLVSAKFKLTFKFNSLKSMKLPMIFLCCNLSLSHMQISW